ILDTPPEQAYDDIVRLASCICRTPIALVSLIDADRQWFKANVGLDVCETPRDVAFCAHAILTPGEVMVVPDAQQDARFADNPLVTGAPGIRFYAGAPLVMSNGQALGTLCIIDTEPRELDATHRDALVTLARSIVTNFELTRVSRELSVANVHLRTLSFIDSLTGLANRRALDARLEEEVARSVRHDGPLAVMLIDIDHFKSYNDTFGHLQGDQVLAQFGELLKQDLRQSDLVARYGGEEFVVLLPETTAEGALMLAERYRERIENAAFAGCSLTASIGVASWHPRHEHAEDLLRSADGALYAAKHAGRNCVQVADEI
ncbi:MAG: sensor domain-containing diguanylate cyclase, partial [Moraxellaceae bacterium]|nr:sensor domain-containing diguanylate cyclase [Moraxellaceae bacterium]